LFCGAHLQLKNGLPPRNEWFDAFARKAATICGKPLLFLIAVGIVLFWAVNGPVFHYSERGSSL
jgi:low affinity Fe/Cu permease